MRVLSFAAARLRDQSPSLDRSWLIDLGRRLERRRLKRAVRDAGIVLAALLGLLVVLLRIFR